MSLESPISILFDSNGIEMAYSQSQALTGSTTGYMLMGSGSTGATFFKVSPEGELFITGSINVAPAGVQQVTGTINVGNQWAFQTGSNNALTVNQGQSGSLNQSWYVSITDGVKVLGTGSSAPIYTSITNVITATLENSTTTSVSQTLASTTNYTILNTNAARKGASFYKEGNGFAYLLLGSGIASATNFTVKLASNSSYDIPFKYTGPVNVVFSTAAAGSFILSTDFT